MRFRDGDVDLDEGELIVAKGVEHCPIALSDTVHCLLVERGTTSTPAPPPSRSAIRCTSGSVPLTRRSFRDCDVNQSN